MAGETSVAAGYFPAWYLTCHAVSETCLQSILAFCVGTGCNPRPVHVPSCMPKTLAHSYGPMAWPRVDPANPCPATLRNTRMSYTCMYSSPLIFTSSASSTFAYNVSLYIPYASIATVISKLKIHHLVPIPAAHSYSLPSGPQTSPARCSLVPPPWLQRCSPGSS